MQDERGREGTQLGQPRLGQHTPTEQAGHGAQVRGTAWIFVQEHRAVEQGVVHIGLHRDRRVRHAGVQQLPVFAEIGIVGVLPDLVGDAVRMLAKDGQVAVLPQAPVHPGKRTLQPGADADARPGAITHLLLEQCSTVTPAVARDETDVQRRGVNRAVIRQVPHRQQLGIARVIDAPVLMQNAAGLFLAARMMPHTLELCQAEDGAARDGREIIQEVERHPECVPTEEAGVQALASERRV